MQRAQERSTLSGFFDSQPAQVASRAPGRVARVLVQEGETVQPGQVLMELSGPVTANEKTRQAQAEQAAQKLREVRNGPRVEEIRKAMAAAQAAQATAKAAGDIRLDPEAVKRSCGLGARAARPPRRGGAALNRCAVGAGGTPALPAKRKLYNYFR